MNRLQTKLRTLVLLIPLMFLPSQVHAHGEIHGQIETLTKKVRRLERGSLRRQLAEALLERGELYRIDGNFPAALADYARAAHLRPNMHRAELAKGRAYYDNGDLDAAALAFRTFLRKKPHDSAGQLWLARTLQRRGDHLEAESFFATHGDTIQDPTPDFFLERASNLVQANEPSAALVVLEDAIAELGPLHVLIDAAIAIDRNAHDFARAHQRLAQLLKREPNNLDLRALDADLLEAMGRAEQAAHVRREVLTALDALPPALAKRRPNQQVRARVSQALVAAAKLAKNGS
jgi:tetratricopeptide (TPR) repeat protein